MKQIPQSFINDLLARSDLVELIDARVPLRKKGNNHTACCPFHNEKTPSFTVNSVKQLYYCFGCGKGGNAISFLMDYDRLSFIEAIETLASQFGLTIPYENNQQAATRKNDHDLYELMHKASYFYQQQLRKQPAAIDYLKQRGLSGQIAKQFGIGYAPAGWDGLLSYFKNTDAPDLISAGLLIKKNEQTLYDRFRDRIMFPIRDKRGRVIGFGGRIIQTGEPKYLNSPETPIFHKGKELYGLYEAYQALRDLPRLLVVEGYMDVVALAQHGIRYAVATLGTAITADHIKLLFRASAEILFCFDGDRAGQAAAWRALEAALPLLQDGWQIKFLLLPENEDPDSLVRKEGKQAFEQRLQKALSLADFLFNTLTQQVNLSSMEGKARLAKLMTPLLNQLPGGVLQHMLYERLANLVRMDVNALKNLLQQPLNDIEPAQKLQSSKRSPMRHVITLLLQFPQLIHSLPETMNMTEFTLPGSELLKQLIVFLRSTPEANTAMVLENWRRDPKTYQQLAALASYEIPYDETITPEKLLLTGLQRLNALNNEKRIELLLEKQRREGLSAAEVNLLNELLTRQKTGDHA